MDAALAEDMLTFLVGYSRRVPGLRCKGVRRMPADEPTWAIFYEGEHFAWPPPFRDPIGTCAAATFTLSELDGLSKESTVDLFKLKTLAAQQDCLELYRATRTDAAQRHGPSLPSVRVQV
jgi:hypothetical protein